MSYFKNIFFIQTLLFISVMMTAPVYAEEDADVSLGKVIVTDEADKSSRTGDVDHETASSFHEILERSDFENKTENLAQVIGKESGVQVSQSGGLGSYSTVSLRGSSSKQVLVYLDGILLNEAAGGGVDLSNIPLNDVQSIEIYRGSTPVNFSRSSIGGIINIKTIRNKGEVKGNVAAGYGSFNTIKGTAYISHKPGKWDYILSADHLSSDNDFKFTNDNGTIYNKEDDFEEKRNNSEFYQDNFLLKTGYDFTGDVRLDFSNQYFNKFQHLPGPHNSKLVNTTFLTRRDVSALALTANKLGSLGMNTRGTADFSWQYEKYDDSEGSIGLGNQKNEYKTLSSGYGQYMEFPFQSNIFILNGDFHYEEYGMKDLLNSREYNPSDRKSFNMAAEDSILLFSESLMIKPAVRYAGVRDSFEDYQDVWGNDQSGFSRASDHITPQIGLRYNIMPWVSIKGNAGKYVREPSFFELFGDRGFFVGNADLKEEKGINMDIGFEIKKSFDSGCIQAMNFSAVYFRSDVNDIITHVYDARGVGRAVNLSSSTINGAESSFSLNLFKHMKLTVNYTYQRCINESGEEYADGNYLPGRFMHSVFYRIEYFNKWISVYFEHIFESGMYYDTANLIEAADKNEENAGFTLSYKDFSFIFEVKNILDSNYEDYNGYPQPGRAYYFTVKYAF